MQSLCFSMNPSNLDCDSRSRQALRGVSIEPPLRQTVSEKRDGSGRDTQDCPPDIAGGDALKFRDLR